MDRSVYNEEVSLVTGPSPDGYVSVSLPPIGKFPYLFCLYRCLYQGTGCYIFATYGSVCLYRYRSPRKDHFEFVFSLEIRLHVKSFSGSQIRFFAFGVYEVNTVEVTSLVACPKNMSVYHY